MEEDNGVCRTTRPWTPQREMVCTKAPLEDVRKIERLSKKLKVSKSEILVRAVRAYYDTIFDSGK
jgi:hypothetical protein